MNDYSLFLQSKDLSSVLLLVDGIASFGYMKNEYRYMDVFEIGDDAVDELPREELEAVVSDAPDLPYSVNRVGSCMNIFNSSCLVEAKQPSLPLRSGYWICINAPLVRSGNIKDAACRGEALKERRLESSIQDCVAFPIAFIKTPCISCNKRAYQGTKTTSLLLHHLSEPPLSG